MQKLVAAVLAVLALAGCSSDYAEPRGATRQMYDSRTASFSGCSGVMLAPRRMLTAAHCVAGDAPRFVGDKRVAVTVLKKDEATDVALLAVALDCPCVPLAASPAVLDEALIGVGFPMNEHVGVQMLTTGLAQGKVFHKDLNGRRLRTSVPVAPGNSGGGFFARRSGQWVLVGVVTNLTADCSPFSLCMVIPHLSAGAGVAEIREFLARPDDAPWGA